MAEKTRCEICNRDFPNQDALAMHNSAKHPIVQEQTKKSMKPLFVIVLIAILLMGGYFIINGRLTGNFVDNQEIQKITLSFKNYNYYPNTIKVKQNIPVEITLDSSVKGCYRSFNIKSFSVSKSSSNPLDTINFTPNKKGSFEFACGMNMGRGTIIVE